MHIIKGLILKDFQALKSYKSTVLFMIILFVGGGFLNDDIINFIPVTLPICFEMLGISSFSYDNLAKSDKYILTFPVNKKDMVKARYIYILLFTLFGSIFGLICTIAVKMIKAGGIINIEILKNELAIALGGLLGIIFLQTFQIPIMYKFGAEKGRIIQLIMIIALMLGISVITTLFMRIFEISLESFSVMLTDYLIAIIAVAVIFIYVLSYILSCKIYEKKEI